MTGEQKWRTWLGIAWDCWKTALEYVPPELAMVFDFLDRVNDWMFGRGTVGTKSCSSSAQQAVWMSSKYPASNFSLPDYHVCGNATFGQASSPTFSEAEIFRSPPPSYDDFSNDVPITPSDVSSSLSELSLGDFIVPSVTRSPSFDISRARISNRDALIGLPTPSPQCLAFLDPLDALNQLTPPPLVVDEPISPAVNSAPTPLVIPTLDVGSLVMDSLDVSGHVYSSPSTSMDWEQNSMRILPSAYDRVGASAETTNVAVNAPIIPRRAGVGTPVRARTTGTPSSRTRRRLRNKENLPPQSPEESSPEPIARRTRATPINPTRRNAIIISSPRSFRP